MIAVPPHKCHCHRGSTWKWDSSISQWERTWDQDKDQAVLERLSFVDLKDLHSYLGDMFRVEGGHDADS